MRPHITLFQCRIQSNKGLLTAQVLRENKILQLLIARVRIEAECLEMMAFVPHQNAVLSTDRSSA